MWRQRVAGWRTSGLTAKAYSTRHGFAANSLRWWSSKLAREDTEARAPKAPAVRFAQVLRSSLATVGEEGKPGAIIVEMLDARVRFTADAGADRETLARVVELVLERRAR